MAFYNLFSSHREYSTAVLVHHQSVGIIPVPRMLQPSCLRERISRTTFTIRSRRARIRLRHPPPDRTIITSINRSRPAIRLEAWSRPRPRSNRHIFILDIAVPVLQGCIRAPQPGLQFMQEQTRIVSTQEIAQQFFRLSSAPLHIHCAENRNHVLQQELGVIPATAF